MESTGIVRQIDKLGRIVLPKELRNALDISINDSLKISVDGSRILMNKCEEECAICNSKVDLLIFKEKMICKICKQIIIIGPVTT